MLATLNKGRTLMQNKNKIRKVRQLLIWTLTIPILVKQRHLRQIRPRIRIDRYHLPMWIVVFQGSPKRRTFNLITLRNLFRHKWSSKNCSKIKTMLSRVWQGYLQDTQGLVISPLKQIGTKFKDNSQIINITNQHSKVSTLNRIRLYRLKKRPFLMKYIKRLWLKNLLKINIKIPIFH